MGTGRHRRPPAWSLGWLACALALAVPGGALIVTAERSGASGAASAAAEVPAGAAGGESAAPAGEAGGEAAGPATRAAPGAAAESPAVQPAAAGVAVRTARLPAPPATRPAAGPALRVPVVPNPALLADAAEPVAVRVPRLRISAGLAPLALDAARELVPPPYGTAGWYRRGPEPGEAGRAVIAGHVDSRTGPDVFYNLRNARRGDRIVVDLADGTRVAFVVQRVGTYPKAEFPTNSVYGGPRELSELRLITCGGAYDRSRGGYQDNVVVFAVRA